jgi:hypothetical protein
MINFEICKEIDDREKVWDVVKDVKKIPEFWKGTRELNVEETSQGIYEGDVRFAFPSKGKVKIEIHEGEKRIIINYLKGPVLGTHEIYITDTKLCSKWNIRLTFPFSLRERWTEEHFKSGTQHALERILSYSMR